LNLATQRLLAGSYPYDATTYLGNFITPLLFVTAPFYFAHPQAFSPLHTLDKLRQLEPAVPTCIRADSGGFRSRCGAARVATFEPRKPRVSPKLRRRARLARG